jgi:hypothetical protein
MCAICGALEGYWRTLQGHKVEGYESVKAEAIEVGVRTKCGRGLMQLSKQKQQK